MEKLKAHVFVCTNTPEGSSTDTKCGPRGGEKLRKSLKKACGKESWSQSVRINSSGCLGHCERGIAAVIYPQANWLLDLTDSDQEKLMKALKDELEKCK